MEEDITLVLMYYLTKGGQQIMNEKLNFKKTLAIFAVAAALIVAPGFFTRAFAQNPHFVGEPSCVLNPAGDTVVCAGKIAGVGTEPTAVGIEIDGGCANKPGHEPGGHVQSVSEPIDPRGGRINFREDASVDCPPGLTPVFGDAATIFIIQGGERTDVGTVPIA
jgi:hypothetical protein